VRSPSLHWAVAALAGAAGLALLPAPAAAQGCEPIRFTTPVSLGGEGEAYQPAREWKVTLAYRRLFSNQWFIGSEESGSLAPGGVPPEFSVHTFVADLAYSFNDRFRARVSVPFSTGSISRIWPDGARHEQSASGIGDISVQGEAWLLQPRTHQRGNIGVGLGVKAPTGSHTKPSQFFTASGPVDFPADQTIQPGDGGWAILTQVQGFRQLSDRVSLYGFGAYMISPRSQTEVVMSPGSPLPWSVPDVYSARAGVAFNVLPDLGLSASLGARLDGIPRRDLFGGGDSMTVKRSSYIIYADPGLSLTRGKSSFTISVPVRMHLKRIKSITEQQPGATPNAGGFAKYLVFASYSHRF
jgi:hypothetical protein